MHSGLCISPGKALDVLYVVLWRVWNKSLLSFIKSTTQGILGSFFSQFYTHKFRYFIGCTGGLYQISTGPIKITIYK